MAIDGRLALCLRSTGYGRSADGARSTRRTAGCSPSCRTTRASAWPSSAAASASRRPRSPSACSGSSATACITGYRTDVDPRALGYSLGAVVRMRPAPRQLQSVAEVARATPEVVECHRVTGEDCFFMKAHVRSSSTSRRSSTASRPTARRRRRSSSRRRSRRAGPRCRVPRLTPAERASQRAAQATLSLL